MAVTRPLLRLWFMAACFFMTWDLCYIFSRPRSFPGGDLHFIWKPYALYGTIDHVYSRKAWENGEGWPAAQSLGNILEVVIMLYHLSLPSTTLTSDFVAFFVSVLTWYKTAIYFGIDYFSGWAGSKHNSAFNFWILYVTVNNFWSVIPFIYMNILGRRLYGALAKADAAGKKTK
ncbi:hypothetical protein DFJ74DRAFT_670827 [Hyaloraphidium curvatum]|nr:hypothetical protein DFJ74DRAFT_670827 [Hyaloraphidium curvatum]